MYRLNNYISKPREHKTLLEALRDLDNGVQSIEYITPWGELLELAQGLELNDLQSLAHYEKVYHGQTELELRGF